MHTSFPKGTPLHIIMKNGDIITGKFKDHKSGRVILDDGKVLELDKVRAMSIRRHATAVSISKKKIVFRSDI